jgi:hypothetical protein
MGNKNSEEATGEYITASDRNSHYKEGLILSDYNP